MTELSIRPEEIRDALDNFVQSYEPGAASREEVGRVSDAGDGIAHVEGLPSVMANELLEFESGVRGLALNLDVREVGVVVRGDFSGIEEGQQVRRTGEVLSVAVGDGYLGRVVDPLGNPLDDRGPIETEVVVNAGGMFAGELGALAGVTVPVVPMAHEYLVLEPSGLPLDMPTMRDPSLLVYFRPESGGLIMGGYERTCAPWGLDGIPADSRAARSDINFLWTTFTRFEPAADIYSASRRIVRNHIAYEPPIVIDARMKPWYPKEVTCDAATAATVTSRWKEYFPAGKVAMGDSERAHLD